MTKNQKGMASPSKDNSWVAEQSLNHPALSSQGGGHGDSGGGGREPPRAARGRRVLLVVLPLVGRRGVGGGRARRVRSAPPLVPRPLGGPRRQRRRRRGRRGRRVRHGVEQLHGLQHRVHGVDGDGVPVVDGGAHAGRRVGRRRPQRHLVARVLHRQVVVAGGAVGGQRVHGPVAGFQAPQRVVHGHRVEQQQRRLAVRAQVPVAGHEPAHGLVRRAERRHAAAHRRLERRQSVGGLVQQRRERLAPALGHERRDVGRRLRRGAAAGGGGRG
uniref:Uncharacterized protein n=1 Tax=Zea mays TaxID=4577 RepID=C4JBP9_MAIZE|nr:unknown [Zea mays]